MAQQPGPGRYRQDVTAGDHGTPFGCAITETDVVTLISCMGVPEARLATEVYRPTESASKPRRTSLT